MTTPTRLREMIAAIRQRSPMAIPQSLQCEACGLLCLRPAAGVDAMLAPHQLPEDAIGLLLMGAMTLAVGNRDRGCIFRNGLCWGITASTGISPLYFRDADYGNSILESCFACFDHATK